MTALNTVGEVNLTCNNHSSTTVLASSTTGIVVGQVVKGTGIPTSPVPTVVSIITNTSFVLSGAATASASVTLTFNTQTLVITGTNFQSGATVTIDGTAPSTVSRDSSTQITVTGTPAKSAGTKVDGLVVTNTSGLAATINVDYNALPDWQTASGTLLTSYNETISTIDLDATTATSYAITTGSLPTGLSMSTSTGDITGTLNHAAETVNFTVTATDAEAQSSPRLFNIIAQGAVPAPTGGTITTHTDGYKVHTFLIAGNGSATNNLVLAGSKVLDILMIAGGGGGQGTYHGAGGGAGGFVFYSQKTLTAATYTIVVGAKGLGMLPEGGSYSINDWDATSGGDTTFTGLTTAVGGGRGGYGSTTLASAPLVGGSGGGGGARGDAGTVDGVQLNLGAAGTQYQGYAGGKCTETQTTWQGTGGGGGAGGVGGDGDGPSSANNGDGGDGGAGKTTGDTVFNFTAGGGATVTFPANFTAASTSTSYCGGGGGGGNGSGGSATHGGGAGSTGAGANASSYGGGGGGSARQGGGFDGGNGFAGVVIVRYAT